jgi:hypothetical protein
MTYVLLPVELSFLALPKQPGPVMNNSVCTLFLSCYILKSIEVVVFEPILLVIFSMTFSVHDYEITYRHIVFILVLFDITKYIILNLYLLIYGSIAVFRKSAVGI